MSISEASTIQFHRIDESDAERLLASIWRALEEHALATPVLDVQSANGLIDVTLTFQSPRDRALALVVVGANTEVAPSEDGPKVDAANQQERRDRIRRWRQRAEELRAVADQFVTPSERETMRRIAGDYERLADNSEALLVGGPPIQGNDRTG